MYYKISTAILVATLFLTSCVECVTSSISSGELDVFPTIFALVIIVLYIVSLFKQDKPFNVAKLVVTCVYVIILILYPKYLPDVTASIGELGYIENITMLDYIILALAVLIAAHFLYGVICNNVDFQMDIIKYAIIMFVSIGIMIGSCLLLYHVESEQKTRYKQFIDSLPNQQIF